MGRRTGGANAIRRAFRFAELSASPGSAVGAEGGAARSITRSIGKDDRGGAGSIRATARRRLAPFLPERREVEVARLLEAIVESADGELA